MASRQLGSASAGTALCCGKIGGTASLAAIALLWAFLLAANQPLWAAAPTSPRRNPYQATTSLAARQSAVRSIPLEKLDAARRAKVCAVLSDVAIFRRMPVHVIGCDPNLYLFLVRHPDVVVNIWEVLRLSNLKLRQIGPDKYRVAEPSGTLADVQFLYRSHDTHVIYAEGSYHGPLLARPIKGRALMVLKTGYVRETNGRYYITTRLDTFLRVDHGGAELLTKTFHPLMGKTADVNFVQTVSFLGSLSRTAELNSRGVQRLAARLANVQPEYRQRLAELAAEMARKSAATPPAKTSRGVQVVSRSGAKPKR